ncbi:Os03g0713150, partial [Oryza sativa Japonica Group]
MGIFDIAFVFPVMRSVSSAISFLTLPKSVKRFRGAWRNSAYSCPPSVLCSCSTRGLLVTIPNQTERMRINPSQTKPIQTKWRANLASDDGDGGQRLPEGTPLAAAPVVAEDGARPLDPVHQPDQAPHRRHLG